MKRPKLMCYEPTAATRGPLTCPNLVRLLQFGPSIGLGGWYAHWTRPLTRAPRWPGANAGWRHGQPVNVRGGQAKALEPGGACDGETSRSEQADQAPTAGALTMRGRLSIQTIQFFGIVVITAAYLPGSLLP